MSSQKVVEEKVAMLPHDMGEAKNLSEAFLYLYFSLNYYDEHLFKVILTKTNNFAHSPNKDIVRLMRNPRAYQDLTNYTLRGTSNKLFKGSD